MSHDRPQKITLAEMRAANVRGRLIYCSDYRCSHWTAISADRMAASDAFNSRCGRFLYSALAETFRAFRGIDFATRLGGLFDLLKSRAIAGRANNLCQSFTRFFHRDQSLKQNKN